MSNIPKAMLVSIIVCIALANMVGITMARQVPRESGKSYWLPLANAQLARDYHTLHGADLNYLGYCFFNLASVLGVVVCALTVPKALWDEWLGRKVTLRLQRRIVPHLRWNQEIWGET